MTTETARIALEARIASICDDMPGIIAQAETAGNLVDVKIFLDVQRLLTEARLNLGCITPAPERVRTCGFARPNITRRGTN